MPKIMANVLLEFGLVQDWSQTKKPRVNSRLPWMLLPVGASWLIEKEGVRMGKTKSSVRGKQHKKIVVVKPYIRKDGVKVGGHRRSTPN